MTAAAMVNMDDQELGAEVFEIFIPVKTVAELNVSRHEPWFVTKKRVDAQHDITLTMLRARSLDCPFKPPVHVTLTRLSSGTLDDFENLPSSMKHVADAIAFWVMGSKGQIGHADRFKSLVCFKAEQQKSKRGVFGVRVEIRQRRVV